MANPQKEKGSTMIANEVLESLYRFFSGNNEIRIILFIIRKTWGWHKKEDKISYNQIAKATNITRRNVIRVVNKLVAKKTLFITKGYINTIRFNKNYDEWIVAKKTLVVKKTLPSGNNDTTLVSNLPLKLVAKKTPTKDNKDIITKDILLRNKEFGNPEINELTKYFLIKMSIPKEDCTQRQSRQYWYLLLKESKKGIDGVKWLIDLASQDEFYKNNISSSKDLYYKRVKIIARKRGERPKFAVMPTGGDKNE